MSQETWEIWCRPHMSWAGGRWLQYSTGTERSREEGCSMVQVLQSQGKEGVVGHKVRYLAESLATFPTGSPIDLFVGSGQGR